MQKVTLHTSLHNIIVCKIFVAFLGRKMSQTNIENQIEDIYLVLSLHHSHVVSTVTGMHLQFSVSSGKSHHLEEDLAF